MFVWISRGAEKNTLSKMSFGAGEKNTLSKISFGTGEIKKTLSEMSFGVRENTQVEARDGEWEGAYTIRKQLTDHPLRF